MKKITCLLVLSLFACIIPAKHITTNQTDIGALVCISSSPNYTKISYFTNKWEQLPELVNESNVISEEIPLDRVVYKDHFYYESLSDSTKEYIYGKSYKENCTVPYESLKYVSIQYYNFKNEVETGEIICNEMIAQDLTEIFYELYLNQYQLESIHLVDDYNADDELSMEANNTSCFNYRSVPGKKALSKHALGLAIDINPFYNPYVTHKGSATNITPIGSEIYADRTLDFPHKITENDLCYQLFISHGFTWGGGWKNSKDYQHFEKKF